MRNNRFLQSGLIVLAAILLGLFDLPGEVQKQILPFLPNEITSQKVNLGLDLQGGSQLDYKVDLRKVPEIDRGSIVEGIISVIQKRVNGLGVSEPNIYSSKVADDSHIIVELAGIKDLDEAKKTVGKTIQLEFKEQRTEPDPAYAAAIKATADTALEKAKTATDFKIFGEGEAQSNPSKVTYTENAEWLFQNQLPTEIADTAFRLEPGQITDSLIETSGEYDLDADGTLIQKSGYSIVKLLDRQTVDKPLSLPRQVKTAHIRIGYKGASGASEDITRTEEEAKARAEEVLNRLKTGGEENTFEKLAKEYSDNVITKDNGGIIDSPVDAKTDFAQEFKTAALALQEVNALSDVTKSPLGFEIVKALEITEAQETIEKADQVKIARLFFNSTDDMWIETDLNGQYFQRANIDFDQMYYQPHVVITFNPEGAKMFEEITARNINKPIAIFVGGNRISAPTVNDKIIGGNAIISGRFTVKEAEELARDLNTGAIPAPILLVGQYNIGASLGQEALSKSLWAGLSGLLLIALFMIVYYRWAGVLATLALIFYTTLLVFLIKSSLPMIISVLLAVIVFGYLIYRILNSKESGPEKLMALVLSVFVLFFLSFLLATPVVLTLAGVAGVILSIGMAVDANILIFERVKEELRDGRPIESAVKVGFDRAWSSIKDSNFSSLITCAILFYFGSSIIQGFAFNLAAGILVSMFSAISVTRVLLTAILQTKLGQSKYFFGAPKKVKEKLLPITSNRKVFYGISAVLLTASVASLFIFGLKPSLDFTGGSLMELKIEKAITTDELKTALVEITDEINKDRGEIPAGVSITTSSPATGTDEQQATITSIQGKLDLGSLHVITAGDNFLVKSKDISADDHDLILEALETRFGNIEETRFQSVGPTIGESLRNKAMIAVLVAILAIIFYIAFAFRRVPKSVGKWKFGAAAIIALIHDVIMLLGIYVVLGLVMGLEIDALFITAILTIMGFSVHDTIVVLDRLREKLKTPSKDRTMEDLTNEAVNETLARSINTSMTAALALLALVLMGGESIKGFTLALVIGIIIGTYSSIFIASPVLVDWYNWAHRDKK